jgi:hypothetical protein
MKILKTFHIEKICLISGCQEKRKTELSFVFELTWQKRLAGAKQQRKWLGQENRRKSSQI